MPFKIRNLERLINKRNNKAKTTFTLKNNKRDQRLSVSISEYQFLVSVADVKAEKANSQCHLKKKTGAS